MIKINPKKEEGLKNIISNFYCSQNQDIENFLKKGSRGYNSTAVMLEDKGITRTYFVSTEEIFKEKKEILGFFSLTLKNINFTNNVSRSQVKKIDGISPTRDSTIVYLIAQLSKNDLHSNKISGEELLDLAINTLKKSQKIVGGRTIMVECEDIPKLVKFYQENGFRFLQKNGELSQFIKNFDI